MLLTWAAIGTSALISVCVWRQWQQRHSGGSDAFQWGAWLAALVAALVTPVWLPAGSVEVPPASEWLGLGWPFPVGVMVVVIVVVSGTGWLRRAAVQAPPAGDLWWLYSVVCLKALSVLRAIARACEKVKMASVAAALALEQTLMKQLTRGLSAEAWMRHHGSGLMMAFAVILALLLMWEGLR